jgi:hypothetical protein
VPSWKVYAAVVLAQYPLFELNTLFILPALERAALASADGGSFGVTAAVAALLEGVSPAVKCLAIQSWTSAGAVFVTLPAAQRLLRWYGFIGGEDRSCPRGRELGKGVAATAATYAALAAGFHVIGSMI